MKIIKIALGVAAAIVALLLIVVAVFAARFDPNSYKAELAALVKDKTGRTLTLEGPLARYLDIEADWAQVGQATGEALAPG